MSALLATAAPAPALLSRAVPACTSQWKAVERVALRRPRVQDGPVVTSSSPVHYYLRKGELVKSCVVAVGRTEGGPAYRACGREGHLWRVVPGRRGGQVPATCLTRA
ncbi:hypothetical protein [Streptomyces sp. NPDC087294]|uniref:hypothetical protein n=1 Tax=Streptomyces sp. NPDC087294 TaxID=3365777 RepID=UPI0037F1C702